MRHAFHAVLFKALSGVYLRRNPGLEDYEVALLYGTFSALTLPLGAVFGVWFSDKVHAETIALWIAFGAGALLFAVTVELYGEAMDKLEEYGYIRGLGEISATLGGAFVGAVVYIICSRWLDSVVSEQESGLDATPEMETREATEAPRGGRLATTHEHRVPVLDVEALPRGGDLETPRGHRMKYTDEEIYRVRGRKRAVMGVLDSSLVNTYARSRRRRRKDSEHYGATDSEPDYSGTGSERESHRASPNVPPPGVMFRQAPAPAAQQAGTPAVAKPLTLDEKVADFRVAGGIWLGVLLDGIPEAIMLGYLAAENRLSLALVVALFISNFPESFSSAALLTKHGVSTWKILLMWAVLCAFTGIVACISAYLLPDDMLRQGSKHHEHAQYKADYYSLSIIGGAIEGMAGGAMLACISNVMLPDAFQRRGDLVGIFVLLGFMVAVIIKVFGGVVNENRGGVI